MLVVIVIVKIIDRLITLLWCQRWSIFAVHLVDAIFVVVQGSQLVVTHARNVNQERGTKQSLQSPKQSSTDCLLFKLVTSAQLR